MQVTSYQMHNVLECYSKKLGRSQRSEKPPGRPEETRPADAVSLSNGANRQAALEKISREIMVKITGAGARGAVAEETREDVPEAAVPAAEGEAQSPARFTYDVIDSVQRKHRATLTEGDTPGLMQSLNPLRAAQKAHRTDSWI
jgi:hypothetical protein